MKRTWLLGLASLLIPILDGPGLPSVRAGEIKRAADAPQPRSPQQSAELFRLPDGFHIELVACEPDLADPVAMCFDAEGRIIVCEIHGYNLDGHLDVQELNKTGELDRKVRRIPANPKAVEQAMAMTYGTVKLLEDTDGDGRMDRSTVWADRLPPCYGVVPARDGVIVLCAPDIVYLADRDGDGKAEVRQTLFTGFGLYDLWSRINNPRWGLDNWIYGANGNNSGGTIRGPRLPADVTISSVCFRFRPDGSALEPANGSAGGYGHAFDDWGDRFLVTNQQHALYVAPLPHRYLARNPFYAAPNPVVNISSYGRPARVYPTSQPHPWRMARSKDPAWVQFYGAAEATANGYFTAASGQAVYRATAFPPEYHGNHFSVDNAQNMVHRCLLVRDGAGYLVERPREDERVEFLTSTERWFRPVNLLTGPDGALYVVDMYREIIEDYSAIPRFLQQQYGLIEGSDRGRIWRVVADGAPQPRKVALGRDNSRAGSAELVAELSNPNAWWRQTAQRLLVERGDNSVGGLLADLLRRGKTSRARLHALYTLDGLKSLGPADVEHALGDPHFAVRLHALRLSESWLNARPALLEKALTLADDADPKVRLQAALTLGESNDPKAVEAVARMATRYGNERWMPAAILSSVGDSADGLLRALLQGEDGPGHGSRLLHPLASVVGARHDDEQIGRLLDAVAGASGSQAVPLQLDCLNGLVEGLQRGKAEPLQSPTGRAAVHRLLAGRSARLQRAAIEAAGLLKLNTGPEMKAIYAAAAKAAADSDSSLDDRRAALGLLSGAPYSLLAPIAEELLDARQPLDVQLAAVSALSSLDDPRVGSDLLTYWPSYTPQLRSAVIDAIFSRQNRLPKLLDAMAAETVSPSSLDAIRRVQLLENADAEIGRRARSLLTGRASKKEREKVLERYQAALKLSRDAERGKTVYEEQCAKCHRLAGEGLEVGPDLSATNNRADETLLSDVMDPSSQITVGYRNYTVLTQDGKIFTGVLAAETATSITLRREEKAEDTILRNNIDEMEASELSMMPEDLDKEVSPQDVADLIAFLRKTLGPVPPPKLTLFEDDPSFADSLGEGNGSATLRRDDRFSGEASLVVTPLQRYGARIPGWSYRVAENPGLGEFRYLRFAWKSPGGAGVMLELAANGGWPSAEDRRRRYYSGRNTTEWQAVQVSPQPPRDWVVVTRDLWKDCGTFTLTGIAPTAMGGEARFDRIELLRDLGSDSSLDDVQP